MPQRFPVSHLTSLIDEQSRYNLGGSYPVCLTWSELGALGAQDYLADLSVGYGTSPGNLRLRAAIATSILAKPDDVIVTMGAVGALYLTMLVLAGPGDEVVTVTPNFPPTVDAIDAVGATAVLVPLCFDEAYRLPLDRLGQALSARTALVVLVTPGNPSGVAATRAELEAALRLIRSRAPGARIVIDETFRRASYHDAGPQPSVASWDEDVITIESLSKGHGAPGLRIGWLICRDANLRRQLGAAKMGTAIACGAVDEALATLILEHEPHVLAGRRGAMRRSRQRVAEWVASSGGEVEWVPPDAGALCCIRLRPERFGDLEVAAVYAAFRKRGVKIAPAAMFGDAKRIFRLGFGGVPEGTLVEALGEMADSLAEVSASR